MALSFAFNPFTSNFDVISTVSIGSPANGLSITAAQVLSLALSSTSTTGALSNTDWNTFNGKQAAGNYITALTGDVTASGPGSVAATIANNAVTDAKFRQSSALSLVGRSANSTGNVADIAAASDGQIMRRSGTAIGFGSIDLASANAVSTSILGVANGGTGLATLTANNVILGNGTSTPAFVAPGSSGNVLTSNGTTWTSAAAGAAAVQTVFVRDVKASGTDGGTATSGSWLTRTLNTLTNPGSFAWVSLASNQITLTAGTYDISASAPFFSVNSCKAKLANITDSTDSIIGSSSYSLNSSSNCVLSVLADRITIASTKVFEIQYRVSVTKTTDGLGPQCTFGVNEVYTTVQITKVA